MNVLLMVLCLSAVFLMILFTLAIPEKRRGKING